MTPIDLKSIDNYPNSIFLGSWCNHFRATKKFKNIKSLEYHWADREKFDNDYRYLHDLVERLLPEVSNYLNKLHSMNKKNDFWRIIIGPWLITFISVIWERYETIRLATNDFDEVPETSVAPIVDLRSNDFYAFRRMLDDDAWNHAIFSEVLRFSFNQEFKTITDFNFQESISRLNLTVFHPKSLFKKFFIKIIYFTEKCIFSVIKRFNLKMKFLMHHAYFDKFFQIKLLISLKSIPTFNSYFKEPFNFKKVDTAFDYPKFEFNTLNNFEQFVKHTLISHMPYSYLKGFNEIFRLTKKVPDAEVILTANAHWYNEVFKIWAAHQVEKSSRLIISEHGGGFPIKYNLMDHPEKISKSFIVWGRQFHNNHHRLPTNKLTKYKNELTDNNFDEITLIDFESVRYGYRAVSAPVGPLVETVFNQNYEIISALRHDEMIEPRLRVLPKYLGSWKFEEIYKKDFGDKIISNHKSIEKVINHSSLIICSYPQTTFSESIYLGKPTILVFDPTYWDIHPAFIELVEVLRNAKVIFFKGSDAVEHIKKISNNISEWWLSESVQEARNLFLRDCLTISNSPLSEWNQFLRYQENR